jgi:phage RecT family recombinase
MSTNVNQKLSIIQKIEQSSPAQLPNIPEVADRFMQLYSIMNGKNTDMARVAYESEKFHFMKLIQDKPELQKCTKLSLYGCFIDMAVQGLSFDPGMKHAYIVGFPTNVGSKDNPKWETRATLLIDGRGELLIRTRQGQIKYADNPIVVYEGDIFKFGTRNDKVFIEHEAAFPRTSDNIIACYLRIERPDASVDYKVFGIEEVLKLKEFSKQKNSLAWTAGLRGMVETKTIKHAFKSYPKVKLGNFSKLQTETVDPGDNAEFKIDYGLNGMTPAPASELPEATGEYTPVMVVEPVQVVSDDEFVQQPTTTTNTVSHDDDDF